METSETNLDYPLNSQVEKKSFFLDLMPSFVHKIYHRGFLYPYYRCIYKILCRYLWSFMTIQHIPFPLWLREPHPDNGHSTQGRKNYNCLQSRSGMVVENAYGWLKGHWRCFLKQNDFKLHKITNILSVYVTHHNFCEIFGEEYPEVTNMITLNLPNPINPPYN